MLQQRTAPSHRFRPDRVERRQADDRHIPLAASTLLLVREQIVSPWRPLLWFWSAVLLVFGVGAVALQLLGPPERLAGDGLTVEDAQPAPLPASAPSLAAPGALPAPVRPQPGPAPQAAAAVPAPLATPGNVAPGSVAPGSLAQQGSPSAGRVALVLHPPPTADGVAIANRLASRAGLDQDQIEVGTTGDVKTTAVIRFYATDDHPLARRLGKELRKMGYAWRIENYAERSWTWKDQATEVWLPDK